MSTKVARKCLKKVHLCSSNSRFDGFVGETFFNHSPYRFLQFLIIFDLSRDLGGDIFYRKHRLVDCLIHPAGSQFSLQHGKLSSMKATSKCNILIGIQYDTVWLELLQSSPKFWPDLASIVDPLQRVRQSCRSIIVDQPDRTSVGSKICSVFHRPPDGVFSMLSLGNLTRLQ